MPELTLIRTQERCWLIQTAGRWPWKSESAKECVTTHLPNQLALKMDGAEASHPHPPVAAASGRPRRVGGRGGPFVSGAARGASTGGAASGADLGGSSKYSREDLEDRSGEGFRVNSSWTRVSRS